MIRQKSTIFLACAGLVLSILLGFFCSMARAEDFSQLAFLPQEELFAQVAVLEKRTKANSDDFPAWKGLGIAFHILASDNEPEFISRSVDALKKVLAQTPRDWEAMCYLGSSTTMLATTTWNPMAKLDFVNQGGALMDKAVKNAPSNITVRMTRGCNSLELPGFLGRGELALEDFCRLAQLVEGLPQSADPLKLSVYEKYAFCLRQDGRETEADHYKNLAAKLSEKHLSERKK
ncbi:hypothetical protein [Dethiosulfatarculus sandiegensis]|uniref:Uncharacterized protein n=1 Tax=Dethiosulfatarculus sandiegensis TaxID=1429043 RepID=A0A0D2HPP7_9BACT|nr:hypothetical protein [Dethiosulfatarculus sandiegensis]KIX12458.1 hypothetical protein X474_19185 [Dethiosulfatarculus sandiegensis]